MNNLYDTLPKEDINEDEGIYTYGDSLAYQFYCGNWSASVKEMKDEGWTVSEFIEYLEHQASDYDDILSEMYNGHFRPSFWANLGAECAINY